MACGFEHTLILTDKVFVLGMNKSGQLGLGKQIKYCNEPTLLESTMQIKNVFAGPKNSFLLTDEGYILAFGLNKDKQLGFDGEASTPKQLYLEQRVKRVQAGFKHSIFVLEEDGLFLGAGSNKQNQLKGISEQMVPFKIDKLNEVVVCWNASIFYKKYSKKLAIWGDSKFGLTSKTDAIEAPE